MIYNKKGLSTIVTTLIIILLVLVAIGIIWVVIRGVVEKGTSEIDINSRCLSVDVRTTSAAYAGNPTNVSQYNITITKKTGTEKIDGVAFVFRNSNSSNGTAPSVPKTSSGDVTLLSTRLAVISDAGSPYYDSVDVIPYFKDDSGTDRLCTQVNSFKFR